MKQLSGLRLEPNSIKTIVLASALLLVLALHLYSLMRFPQPFVDEAWMASRAWSFLETGKAYGALDAGVSSRFPGYWTAFPWLPTAIQSLGYRITGSPTLLPLRAISLVAGMVLLVAVFFSAKTVGGSRLGWLSVILVALSRPFLVSAHWARADIFSAALGWLAIALYLLDTRGRLWLGLLGGLCVGLAIEIHPNAVIYAFALLGVWLWKWRLGVIQVKAFWGFLAGLAVGLLAYASYHILTYPATYLALNRILFAPTRIPPLLTLDPVIIGRALWETGVQFFAFYHLWIALVVLAVINLWRGGSQAYQELILLGGLLFLGNALVIPGKAAYYVIYYSPAIDILVAAYLLTITAQAWSPGFPAYLKRVAVFSLCAAYLAFNLASLRIDASQAYQAIQSQINQSVQPGEAVIGPQTYWFGLYEHPYYSWEELVYYRRYAPGSTLEEAFRSLQPDIFILDERIANFIRDETQDEYLGEMRLPRDEMEAFLVRRARLIRELDSELYGPIRIYHLDWDTGL